MVVGGGDEGVVRASPHPEMGIFLSAVSSEFSDARSLLRTALSKHGQEVKEQTEFLQGDDDTTLGKLHTYIAGCSTVVCIVGRRAGASPPENAAKPFRVKYSSHVPTSFDPSFTQWELIFARALDKQLRVYQASEDYVPDRPAAVEGDDEALQRAFVEWIFESEGRDRTVFATKEELALNVVLEVPAMPTANGSKVQGTMTTHGIEGREAASSRQRWRAMHHRRAPSLSSDTYEMRGREKELEQMKRLLTRAREQFVEVVGPAGVGKKKLLSQFEDDTSLVAEPADRKRAEDLVQSAWESLVAPPQGTVMPDEREEDLEAIETIVFAADVDSPAELGILLHAMPKARFVVTAQEPIPPPAGGMRTMKLGNLGDGQEQAMLDIFGDRFLDSIPEESERAVIDICRGVKGNPGYIAQLGVKADEALASDEVPTLDEWIAEHRLTTEQLPSDMQSDDRGHEPADVVGAVGEDTPKEVVESTTSREETDAAEAKGEVLRGSPRYRADAVPRGGGNPELLDEVLGNTVDWARLAGRSEIFTNRAFVVRMVQWGVERGRWDDVIEIGRRCEPAMALGGRHGAWEEVLQCALVAAREIGDGRTEGWALHELGSRSLIRDEMADARGQLASALRTRQVHDPRAVALTRANLRLVPGAVISLLGLVVAAVVGVGWGAAVAVSDDMYDQAIAEIPDEVGRFGLDGDRSQQDFTIQSVGTGAFAIDLAGLELPAGFSVVDADACPDRLGPGEECTFQIVFTGADDTGASLDLSVGLVELPLTADEGVEGDRRILLLADGAAG